MKLEEGVDMPKVSIIIPMFNAEESIKKCLVSLMKQSFTEDYEILVMDDGSNDKSSEIVKELSLSAPYIKYHFHSNQGISVTRNDGLALAQGEYICFIDSDDYVHENYLDELYKKSTACNSDITVCDFYECKSDQHYLRKLIDFKCSSVFELPELSFEINTAPWNKMFKKSFLQKNNISFPVGKKYEDASFMLSALLKAKCIAKVNRALVYYQVHAGSETMSMNERVFDIFDILLQIQDIYQNVEMNKELMDYLTYFAINRINVYQLQQVYQKDRKTALSFVRQGYAFLDYHYPEWKSNRLFCDSNSWIKRRLKSSPFLMNLYVRIFWKGSGI